MKLIDKIKSKVSKKEFLFICLFSVMFVFNYFIFNQFDILLNNPAEFGVTTNEIIGTFILFSIIILVLSVVGLIALCCYSKKGFAYTLATFIGLILAGYAQVLFMNEGVMTFVTIDFLGQYILNILIYALIIAVPIVILYLARKKQKGFAPKLAVAICFIIFGMQFVGLTSVAASAPQAAKNNELYYFSIDEQLKLSKNENIIIFVMDMMDAEVTDKVFYDNPETKQTFNGFTYYNDSAPEYLKTFPSIVSSMLTGEKYDETTKSQVHYMKEAWKNEILLSALKDNNYTVNGLMEYATAFYDFNDLEGKFDNIKMMERKNRIIKGGRFFGGMLSYAFMRHSPIILQPIVGYWRSKSSHSVEVKGVPDYFPSACTTNADLKFYDKLVKQGLSIDTEKEENVFSFVHLHASHFPYTYNENLKRKNSNVYAKTRGSFKILDEYFSQMKGLVGDNGETLYDNSTIIVLADHGGYDYGNDTKIENPPTAALLIKQSSAVDPLGKDVEPLRFDYQSQMSHSNFIPTILEIIGEDSKKTAGSYFDVINGNTAFPEIKGPGVQTRTFYFVRYMNLASSKFFFKYEIIGHSNTIYNWNKIK